MSSLILRTAMRLIVPLTLLFGGYMTLRGHNNPGGGFIGGLVLAVGLVLFRLAYGAERFEQMVPVHPRWLVMAGLSIAGATVVVPMLIGYPALTSTHAYILYGQVHFTTAAVFDLGVLLVVVGAAVGMIGRLSQEVGQ